MGKKDDKPKQDWLCRSCTGRNGGPFKNFANNDTCHLCKKTEGNSYWKDAPHTTPSVRSPSFAEKQLKAEADAKKALQKELASLRKQLKQ